MYDEYLAHYGVRGMKWGKRKRQLSYEQQRRSREQKLREGMAQYYYKKSPWSTSANGNAKHPANFDSSKGYRDKQGNIVFNGTIRTAINRAVYKNAQKKVIKNNTESARIKRRAKNLNKNQKKQKVENFINGIFKKKKRK